MKHLPNFLTCLNLVFGTLGCISMANGDIDLGIIYVLISGSFDFLDGLVARLLKFQSLIGKQLDSLADIVSFGVLPTIFMVTFLHQLGPNFSFIPYFGLAIAPFSAIRLAVFNLDETQSNSFKGLPTPANAIMITSLPFLPFDLSEIGLIGITLFSCFFLVSRIEMLALKFSSFSIRENFFRYLLIVLSVTLLVVFKEGGLPFIIPSYIVLSVIRNFITKKVV